MKYLTIFLALANALHAAPAAIGPNGEGLNQSAFLAAVLPVQTGQSGKYLKTNGTVATWEEVVGGGGAASTTTSTATGNIAATNVQDAIAELDTEKVATTTLSTAGGVNKVLQADANGNWRLGPVSNGNAWDTGLGDLFMPDKRKIKFHDQSGNYDAGIFNWGDHNGTENELIIESLGRIAIAPYKGMQFGPNDSQRYQRYIQMVSGNASNSLGADENLMPSGGLLMQTKAWNSGAATENTISMQGIALGGTNSLIRFVDGASILTNRTGDPTATLGDIAGTPIAEIYKDGIWSPGTAPAFNTLTATSNVFTQTCSKYKTVQIAKLTLGATNTLAISGAVAGMRGVIFVSQDATGGRLLTMPSGSALPGDWALSTLGNKIDRLAWEFDGIYFYWIIKAGLNGPLDSHATAFIAAASITDDTQKTAINNMVLALKASGSPTLWDKTYRVFPFVGGNATKHRYELKSATAAGTFVNGAGVGITHDANGITGDGTGAYMQTGFIPSASSAQNSIGVFAFCRTTLPTAGGMFMNAYTAGTGVQVGMYRNGVGLGCRGLNSTDTSGIISQASDFRGLLFATRSGASAQEFGKMGFGGIEVTSTIPSTANCTGEMMLLARNWGSPDLFSNANLSIAMITQYLDPTERAALKTIIDTFQTALGRANP
jgi:hypothetical protein